MERFRYLFSPVKIGNVEIPNRIYFLPHGTNYIEGPMDSGERQAYYLVERVKAGVGLVGQGGGGVTLPRVTIPEAYREQAMRRNKLITGMVHQHGAKIFGQLSHGVGRQHLSLRRPEMPPVSSSSVPCPTSRFVPHQLEIEEIEALAEGTEDAARRIREAGFDGIEFHATHAGYLVQQFLSPYSNKRTDAYGGSLENRMRFLFRSLEAARRGVGYDYVVGLRLTVDEFVPNGLTLEESKEIARRLEASGKINYLSVDAGTYSNGRILIFPEMSFPLGFGAYLAGGIREAAPALAIVASHRIGDPLLAEQILADGQADLIGMARPLLCDPELPRKTREGRLDDIRRCVACNLGCTARLLDNLPIVCVQNPVAGREMDESLASPKPASEKKKIVVIGGGPGGLKAAEMAAQRGHDVVLYEKEQELGGQVALQTRVASRQEYGEIVRHLIRRIGQLKVKVKLGQAATVELVDGERPDAVIVATGSVPNRTGYTNMTPELSGLPGAEQGNVLTEFDVLNGADVGQRVVVVEDTEGDYKAPLAAEYLADRGKQVEIITTASYVGMSIPSTNLFPLNQRLMSKGVKYTTYTAVKRIEGNSIITSNVCTNEEGRIDGVDTVVLVIGHLPNCTLYQELKGKVKDLYLIGDAYAPRRVEDAIHEGYKIGCSV